MLKVQVEGRGLIPRGLGLAPRKNPFPADLSLISTIMSTPGLSLRYISPDDGKSRPLTKQNLKRVWEKYGVEKRPTPPKPVTPDTGNNPSTNPDLEKKEEEAPAAPSEDKDETPPAGEAEEGKNDEKEEEPVQGDEDKKDEAPTEPPAPAEGTEEVPGTDGAKEAEGQTDETDAGEDVPAAPKFQGFAPVLNPNEEVSAPVHTGGITPVLAPENSGAPIVSVGLPVVTSVASDEKKDEAPGPGSFKPVTNPNDRNGQGKHHNKNRR